MKVSALSPQIEALLNPQQRKRLEQVKSYTPSLAPLFATVYAGKSGYAGCVKAQCLECVGWERDAVRTCTATACPLWHKRPYRRKTSKQ